MFSRTFYSVIATLVVVFAIVGFWSYTHIAARIADPYGAEEALLSDGSYVPDNFESDEAIPDCTTAPIPRGHLSEQQPPSGWSVFTDPYVGFKFFYPSTIRIERATDVRNSLRDYDQENCVYDTLVVFRGATWEARLRATRGGFGTGREGFGTTSELSFTTQSGQRGVIAVDEQCGDRGRDCGQAASFEDNGVVFMFDIFPDEAGQIDFGSLPKFEEIFSTLETATLGEDRINNVDLIGFTNAPSVLHEQAKRVATYYNETNVAPDPTLDRIELVKLRERVWDNECLADKLAYPDRCPPGTFRGYEALVRLDSEYQLWMTTQDGAFGNIAGAVDIDEVLW